MTNYFSRLIDQTGLYVKSTEQLGSSYSSIGGYFELKVDNSFKDVVFSSGEERPFNFDSTNNDMESTMSRSELNKSEQTKLDQDTEVVYNNVKPSSTLSNTSSIEDQTHKKDELSKTTATTKKVFDDELKSSILSDKNYGIHAMENNIGDNERKNNFKINSFSNNNPVEDEKVVKLIKRDDHDINRGPIKSFSENESITNKTSISANEYQEKNLDSQLEKIREWMTKPSYLDSEIYNKNKDVVVETTSHPTTTTTIPLSTDTATNDTTDTIHMNTKDKFINTKNENNSPISSNQNLIDHSLKQQEKKQQLDKIQSYSLSIGTISITIEAPSKDVSNNNGNFTKNKENWEFSSINNNNNHYQNKNGVSRLSRYYVRTG